MDLYGTLGASCARREILTAMFQAGMTGARLNLSHTTLPECASLLEDEFWPAARQAGVEASLIVDLQGPELRVGRLEEPVPLREGGSALLGASGIVFMMILMASFGGARNGVIPITTIFVAVFYLGGELWNAIFQQNNIAELAHIVGGLCGMLMGFALSGKRKR